MSHRKAAFFPLAIMLWGVFISTWIPTVSADDYTTWTQREAEAEAASPAPQGCDAIDLHAHLFMKQGMGLAFFGDFEDPMEAKNYKAALHSQADPLTLERSGLGVVVVSFYALPVLEPNRRDAIRAQIKQAHDFVDHHPDWVIAKTPQDAIDARKAGKRVMIFSLEGTAGIIESEKDVEEFVDKDGIRIVTYSHLKDDGDLDGAAFLHTAPWLVNPFAWIKSKVLGSVHCEGVTTNLKGLEPDGTKLAALLIQHHAWIDLTHASDATQRALIPLMQNANQPLLYTHEVLRKYYGAERGMAQWQLDAVKNSSSGGIVGVLPSESYLRKTPSEGCGGIKSFAVQYNEVASAIGPENTLVGTDTNGAVPHLKPTNCVKTGTSLDQKGYWNVSQECDLWKSLKAAGGNTPDRSTAIDHFLASWAKLFPATAN